MGGRLHVYGAFGEDALQWLHQQQTQAVNYNVTSSSGHNIETAPDPSQPWWQGAPPHPLAAQLLEQARSERGSGQVSPGEWQVTAPNLHMSMRVWEVDPPQGGGASSSSSSTGGDGQDSFTLLHQPASMTLRFTQALSR